MKSSSLLVSACLSGALIVLPCLLSAGPTQPPGHTEPGKKPGATVEDLKFMAGNWRGQIFGGPIDERWHVPEGGVMVGTSRMGTDAARTMYEFMLIEEKNGAPTMFLRHFRQYLGTTETQPMEFVLKKVNEGKAWFETDDKSHSFTHIAYELEGKDTLIVRLKGSQGGKPSVIESRMTRTP